MALYYQTEYRMGRRGRVCRAYTGPQAVVAIVFDLIFGLLFELITLVIQWTARFVCVAFRLTLELLKTTWRVLVAGMTIVVYVLTLPFALLHRGAAALRVRIGARGVDSSQGPALKPDWALGREL